MKMQIRMNGFQLKIFAIICMTIDHAALLFVQSDCALYFLLRGIGRWTAPIMAFLIAEGFRHTRSFRNYLSRMLLFAVFSQPFYYVLLFRKIPESITEFCSALNVLFSMSVALMMLKLLTTLKYKKLLILLLFGCLLVSGLCDWSSLIPVWAIHFYYFRKSRTGNILFLIETTVLLLVEFLPGYESFAAFSFQLCTLTALLPISCYNGERGGSSGKLARSFGKWFFYCYYPLHIGVLVMIWMLYN